MPGGDIITTPGHDRILYPMDRTEYTSPGWDKKENSMLGQNKVNQDET